MVKEETDDAFSIQNNTYTVKSVKSVFLLKRFKIKKKVLKYSFIGGMWYTKTHFTFQQDISLPYPFSTYYTFKILDIKKDGVIHRSTLYAKTPLFILQYNDSCIGISFDPVIHFNDTEIYPFISLEAGEDHFVISFSIFSAYDIKTKPYAWLGKGKKETISIPIKKGDTFRFNTKIYHDTSWQNIVQTYFESHVPTSISIQDPEKIFQHAKKALWRSYDHITGSFLQLPWREEPGFTFQNSSHSLLAYEAVRLDYFNQWYRTLKDPDFLKWGQELKKHFLDPNLSTTPSRKGEGEIWYNMTNLTKKGLAGYFYMDCGYSGYPGGQSTIVYHLLNYMRTNSDEKLLNRIQKTIQYIVSTQQENGSWPMAIHQEGLIKFRPEKLEKFTTSGGTGESVRALLHASEVFNDQSIKDSAERGLEALKTIYPICYHGLRDIGIQEPEAFSAVSIIHAFLDGYDRRKDQTLLDQAFIYAWYLAPWIYTYNTRHWHFSYTLHPISYSITPRVSPYETVWVVSLFLRLARYSKDTIWGRLARLCYISVLPYISETGGLSEGVFPIYNSTLQPIPMEQTFATVELMHASYQLMDRKKKQQIKTNILSKKSEFTMNKDDDTLHIYHGKELLCSFDSAQCKIIFLKNGSLGTNGITVAFNGPYKKTKKIKQKLKMSIRGPIGKYLLGAKDAKYAITGVKPPTKKKDETIDFFSDHITSHSIDILSQTEANLTAKSQYHQVTAQIHVGISKGKPTISIDPFEISVLSHDLEYTSIFAPVIDAKIKKVNDHTIQIDGCTIKGDFTNLQMEQGIAAIKQTCATNWTHGGVFSSKIDFIFDI